MNSYKVTGCEESIYNDIYHYRETTGNGDVWWKSGCDKTLRYSPGWGWSLGWYNHSSKNEIAYVAGIDMTNRIDMSDPISFFSYLIT